MLTTAMLVSLTNPKALLASLMLYPLFIRDAGSYAAQSVVLGLVAMVVSFGVYGGYVLAASLIRRRLVRSHRANKIVGAFYLGAAGALAAK
ncbi:LysE family transporter [Alcanivorax sp. IO_7]|nr:LysE family transporter [Alcanivorax sp. IO_7]